MPVYKNKSTKDAFAMATDLRKTGIRVIGDMPWGTHFCLFYETKQDLLDTLVPYFKAGLENGEFCLWVLPESLTEEEARWALRQVVPDLDRYLSERSIELLSHDEWFLEGGTLDLHRIINCLNEKLTQALARGYDGLRMNGSTAWFSKERWNDFHAFEKELEELIANQHMIVLCNFPLTLSGAAEALDAVRAHQLTVVMRHGNWEIVETPELRQTRAENKRLNEENNKIKEAEEKVFRLKRELEQRIVERTAALQKSEEKYCQLIENTGMPILSFDYDGRLTFINQIGAQHFNSTPAALVGKSLQEFFPKSQIDAFLNRIKKVIDSNVGEQFEDNAPFPAGRRWFWLNLQPIKNEFGKPIGVQVIAQDITERKRAEEAQQKSEAELRTLFAAMTDVVMVLDAEGRYVKIAPTNPVNLYRPSEQLLGKKIHEILPKEDADKIFHQIEQVLESHQTVDFEYKLNIGSREVWFDGRVSRLTENTVFWIAHDMTERKRAEDDLRKQKEILQRIFDHLPVMISFVDEGGHVTLVNRAWERTLGWTLEEIQEQNLDIFAQCYPDPQYRQKVLDFVAAAKGEWVDFKMRARNGQVIDTTWARIRLSDGTTVGIGQDITERKQLEEQLRQSQKMEAIGQLAGGIAHDFNNLLTAITVNCDLAIRQLQAKDPLRSDIEEIMKAGERAISLTRQLLAFSRKQFLQPKALNLNFVVSEVEKMLCRLIGDDIELRTVLESKLGSIKADPGQIEQIIMNLAVNARDAMPQGGKLTIQTQNVYLDEEYAGRQITVSPGPYVMLAVTDTGIGMDEQTQRRIFEPFFTTKEVGKGTGLGLSTVYGIVKQAGGNIEVCSEVGKGTSFSIYLPRIDEVAQLYKPSHRSEEALQGSETILLVEDNEIVRKLIRKILKFYGYQVLEATNGGAAFLICERDQRPIHLLLTDVIMPEIDGCELANRLTLLRPEMKVLYVSGYTGDVIVNHSLQGSNVPFLQKPFTPDALARKVREVLGAAKK